MNPTHIEEPQPFVVFVDGMDGDVYPDAEGMLFAVQHAMRHGAKEVVVKPFPSRREEAPAEPEKPAPKCASAYSTVRTVYGAVELLRTGWELGYSQSTDRHWFQKGLCKGGPSRRLHGNIFRALVKRGIVAPAPRHNSDPYWLARYELTK